MKTLLATFLLMMISTFAQGQGAGHEAACRLRSTLFESIARERDRGVSKDTIIKRSYAQIPQLRNTGFEEDVDAIYTEKGRKIPPEKLGALILTQCLDKR